VRRFVDRLATHVRALHQATADALQRLTADYRALLVMDDAERRGFRFEAWLRKLFDTYDCSISSLKTQERTSRSTSTAPAAPSTPASPSTKRCSSSSLRSRRSLSGSRCRWARCCSPPARAASGCRSRTRRSSSTSQPAGAAPRGDRLPLGSVDAHRARGWLEREEQGGRRRPGQHILPR
jgi:hypothetical protein